jgi:hypothetical protein
MKKNFTLIATAIVLLSSCRKNDEILKHTPGNDPNPCQILQITYPLGSNNDVLQFTYNSLGDPVSCTRMLGGHTGYPNFAFKYDDRNRLTDFIGPYDNNTTAEIWHRYFYNPQGDIILDSTYVFPRIVNGYPENAFTKQLTYYTYDHKRRIIKDSTVYSNPTPPVVHTYAYDANGNRTGSAYDNKININQTHKIWMFLNKDYSINNPFTADSYTAAGLPANINLSEGGAFSFLGNDYRQAQINYACDSKFKNK